MSDGTFVRGIPDDFKPSSGGGNRQTFEFRLKAEGPDSKGMVMFTDDEVTLSHEHRVDYNKRHNVPKTLSSQVFTCPGRSKCPLCRTGDLFTYYSVALCTVLDLKPFTKNDGDVIPVTRRIIRFKSDMINYIKNLREQNEGLLGLICKVVRTGPKKPASGDMWTVQKKANKPDQVLGMARGKYPNWECAENILEAIDYPEELAPLSIEDLELVAKGEIPDSMVGDDSGGAVKKEAAGETLDFGDIEGEGSKTSSGGGGDDDLGDLPF